MKYYMVRENPHFIGRETYWSRLQQIDAQEAAAVIVVYGRRRVVKTELIEQFFRKGPILKFEGLQPQRSKIKKDDTAEKRRQIEECLVRLDR
jgi:AAA+ ATPase superfamily predicted ATPase